MTSDISALRGTAATTRKLANDIAGRKTALAAESAQLTDDISTALATGADAKALRAKRAAAESEARDLDAAERKAHALADQADQALARAEQPAAFKGASDATLAVVQAANALASAIEAWHGALASYRAIFSRANLTDPQAHPQHPSAAVALMGPVVRQLVAHLADYRGQTL